jgi:hypothetical protein
MKVKFLGETSFLVLTNDKEYEVISIEKDWYRIIDDSGDDYLYHPELFEVMEDTGNEKIENTIKRGSRHNNPKNVNIAVAGK